MDELLAEMNNCKHVKQGSKSLKGYATMISAFVNDMEDNGCTVLEFSEAPFFMSQLLSKLIQETTQSLEERCKEQERKKMCQTS